MDESVLSKPRVRIVQAHRKILDQEALDALLKTDPEIDLLGSTTSLEACIELCISLEPHIVLLDAGFLDHSSFEITSQLRENATIRGIFFLDDEICTPKVVSVLGNRFTCYYCKQTSFAEISKAIRQLYRGKVTFDPHLRNKLISYNQGRSFRLETDGPSIVNLTTRELEVMKLLAEGRSLSETANLLKISMSTASNHKIRLMRKLQVHKTSQLTRIAIGEGLIGC